MPKPAPRSVRLRKAMTRCDVDMLVCGNPENQVYVTGYNPGLFSSTGFAVVALNEDDPIVIAGTPHLSKSEDTPGKRRVLNYGNWHGRPCYGNTWQEAVKTGMTDYLSAEGLTVGYESGVMQYLDEWKALFPKAKFVEASDLISECRFIKDDDEIDNMRKARHILDGGMQAAIGALGKGMNIQEATRAQQSGMWDVYLKHYRDNSIEAIGSGESPMVCSFQPWMLAGSTLHHQVRSSAQYDPVDELVLVHSLAAVNNYYAEFKVAVPVGNVPEKNCKALSAAKEIQTYCVGLVKPGVTFGTVYRAGCMVYDANGYKPSTSIGRGIGVGCHEPRRINNAETVFKVNMVFTIEPSIDVPSDGIMTVGSDIWVVNESGCERLYENGMNCYLS